eukprot:gnl/Spiro4/9916_TR5263_c0_g2_i1.p1 gnl/Spiro4/9916_TR5263_c0_g2~~gnl/Spiro4/9916_TR5263_c0_g2_i1.p1  ORF type:complete len:363 (-),score=66.78 gnl/Spiro4/9916_TR5263_c0_g2_i1:97-1185(-)
MTEHRNFFQPEPLFASNQIEGSEYAQEICVIAPPDLVTRTLGSPDAGCRPEVVWEEAPQRPHKRAKKRRRKSAPKLNLVVVNPTTLPVSFLASLPARAHARHNTRGVPAIPVLRFSRPLSEASEYLPAELGTDIEYCTLSAMLPPCTSGRLCSCSPDADKLRGFVYLLGHPTPHPLPDLWENRVLMFPLRCDEDEWFLCTQGFGGGGHHRGPQSHHAADFACREGTVLAAVGDGEVVECSAHRTASGAHVALLPEANTLSLRLVDGSVAVYLHLLPGSALVRAGERVSAGQAVARSGNTGFSLGPHVHLQLNAHTGPDAHTVMFALDCGPNRPPCVPVAGYQYHQCGGVRRPDGAEVVGAVL